MEDKFIGKRLDGRYEIRELIGVGGMAMVYKAYDNTMDRIVAVKILKEEFSSNEDFLRRFKNESKAVSMLSHPNIVKVFDVSIGDLLQYIVMEYIDGITLKEYIEQQGKLEWKDAVHFTIQILRGLQHAHDKGIVHRDVKPQNVMVLANGTIKVTDFGIARFARSGQRTITDKAIGSVHYISPEQARGDATADKADIYSVGVILYEMLTGNVPFEAESAVSVAIMQLQREPTPLHEIDPSIPLGLEQITMHAMQKDSNKRYHSAAEMLCNLDEFKKDPDMTFEYSPFVDTNPTKYVSDVVDNYKTEPVDAFEEEQERSKAPIIPILTGVAAAFVVGLVVLGAIFLPKLFGDTGDEQTIPNFAQYHLVSGKEGEPDAVYRPMTYQELLEDDDINSRFKIVVQWKINKDYEYGCIYDSDPRAGRKVKKGTTVTVYVSGGEETVTMPNIHDQSESVALATLKEKGLEYEIVRMPDEDVQAGFVIKTEPEAATKDLPIGTKVTVYISEGKATKYVNLPDVVGLKEEAAKKQLKDAGLQVGTVTQVSSSMPAGLVTSQTPSRSSQSQVGVGTVVNLCVSKGLNKFAIKVPVPADYIASTGYISLWKNGGNEMMDESGKINLKDISEYSFNVSTEKETLNLVVKLSADNKTYDDYLQITVDCTNKTTSITTRYDYPKSGGGESSNKTSSNKQQ